MSTTVRISSAGHRLLADLARETDSSMASVLEAALEAYRRQLFLNQSADAFALLVAEPAAAAAYRADLASFDHTLADGLPPSAP